MLVAICLDFGGRKLLHLHAPALRGWIIPVSFALLYPGMLGAALGAKDRTCPKKISIFSHEGKETRGSLIAILNRGVVFYGGKPAEQSFIPWDQVARLDQRECYSNDFQK